MLFLIFHIRDSSPSHLILPYLIILTIFCVDQKIIKFQIMKFPASSYIFPSLILYSNLSLPSSKA
jgi:hypothetical protein